MKHRKKLLHYFSENLMRIVGIVLIWRGIWYILDAVDHWFFGGSHFFTVLGGIVGGLLILYLPDKDLKELERI